MTDFRSVSPSSDVLSDGMDSLSMRDKTLLKRSISKHHNNNFKAGYVPVHEQYLNKTGLRGRKTFAFWTLVFLLFILAIGNLILTIIILGVLRLGQGMQSLELVPEELAMKFFGETDLGNIYKRDGKLEGFWDIPVEIIGDNGSVFINVAIKYGRSINKFKMDRNDTIFRVDQFEIKNKQDKVVFSTNSREFKNFKNLNSINTRMVESNRIVSPINKKLSLEGKTVNLKGAEGTLVEGREVSLHADQDIHLQSNKSLVIIGKNGIFVDTKKLPTVISKHTDFGNNAQYKVCICMPQGKLFKLRVPNPSVRVYCNQIDDNPCM